MHTDGLGGTVGHIYRRHFPQNGEGDPETGLFSPGRLGSLSCFGGMGWDPSSCLILICLNKGYGGYC